MNKLKVIELFGGIGACSKALERLGINFEIVDSVEIDKYAVKSFNAIHNTNFEPQDICKWDKNVEVDLIMHGSPCQDFSLAGKQAGGDKDSGTRSSLMYETIRIVEKLKPKYVVWENVKNLLSKKHRHNFDAYLETMENLGYVNYYQVLNAKDYGIPQNRERIFTVSIKKEYVLRGTFWHGIDDNDYEPYFDFPPKQELKLKLKDMLEDEVDEKYYLSGDKVELLKYNLIRNKQIKDIPCCCDASINDTKVRDISNCITSRYDAGIQNKKQIGLSVVEVNRKYGIFDTDESKHQAGSVYDENGLAPTLDTMQGGWRQPCIEIKNATKKGYLEATDGDGCYIQNIDKKRGTVQKEMIPTLKTSPDVGCVVDKPRKDIKELDKYCKYCGDKLERKRFNGRLEDFKVFSNRQYCNRECMKKDYLKIGKHNQSYSNAHATARKINELILHKDVCEICGSKTNLDIHHIDGDWQNNSLDNLMCLCRSCHTKYEKNKNNNLRIRKLTPRETWRLMGFDDEDFEKAAKVNSNTQLYKQAGNSICVPVLEAIFKNLLKDYLWSDLD